MKRLAQASIIVPATVALLFVLAGQSVAYNWLGYYLGTDQAVVFRQCNLETAHHDAFHWNDTNNVEPNSYINTTLYHSCLEDEVEVLDGGYGDTSWLGRWYCQSWQSSTVCAYGNVQINLDKEPSSGWTTTDWRHLSCQEVGHSVMLDHHADSSPSWYESCMGGPGTVWLDTHDHSELNSIWSNR